MTVVEAVATMPVIVVADVGPARPSTKTVHGNVSAVVVIEALQGARRGEKFDVHWRAPDGVTCDVVRLRPGRWLLFLDGGYAVGWCNQYSRRVRGASSEAVELVRRVLHPKTVDEVVALLRPVAERELREAWRKAPSRAFAAGDNHDGPWVNPEAQPEVTGDAKNGWRVRWGTNPPAGFAHEFVATVREGNVHVVTATVSFAPD